MSNVAKIAIGCFTVGAIVILLIVGVVGYFGYTTFNSMNQIGTQGTRLETLNTTYPFSPPTANSAIDQKRFAEFMVIRAELETELSKNKFLSEIMKSMSDPNYQPNIGVSDTLEMMSQIGDVLKLLGDTLEQNQMSLDEYNYYRTTMVELVYQSALQGDKGSQNLINTLEKALADQNIRQTNWQNPQANTFGLGNVMSFDPDKQFQLYELELVDQYKDQLTKSFSYLGWESIFMISYQNQLAIQNGQTPGIAPPTFVDPATEE